MLKNQIALVCQIAEYHFIHWIQKGTRFENNIDHKEECNKVSFVATKCAPKATKKLHVNNK